MRSGSSVTTALAEGTWTTLGAIAFLAAALSLGAAFVYVGLTWRQDHEERTRPERRDVTIELAYAEDRRRGSIIGLVFTIVAILTVIVLSVVT